MLTEDPRAFYTSEYFEGHFDGAGPSAAVVVPLVLSLVSVKAVIDVGCGVGPWAAEFLARGVPDVWGVDGDYVDRSLLRIPLDRFVARDLTKPFQFDRVFDLAVCLEVAEHLPESRAGGLVADLTCLARCVLFSAAVPGQGGAHHINEQYLSYWVDLFERQGYEGVEAIRPWILGNNSVQWWYQQNIVMFAAPGHPLLAKGFPEPKTIIHENLYESRRRPAMSLKMLVSAVPGAVRRSIRYHLGLK
jgi:SAM-dependent methyltransferase